MPSKLQVSMAENSSPAAVATNSTSSVTTLAAPAPKQRQTSVFAKLPPELVLHIFAYLDIVAIFRFMDTCHFHRHLLLDLPEAWHRVRFVPISEYTANYSSHGNGSTTSAAASSSVARFHRAYRASGALSSRPSSPSPSPSPSPRAGVEHRKENKRDEDRGGSQSPISEVYAVLRRFRDENGLLPRVREIYMDSIDMPQFPSPLVMMFKFPNLRVLSSRHRRKQTSLATDVHLLKDMLRNGHVLPHSLKLERWDIWHPYMAEDEVVGFQRALNAICRVGYRAKEDDQKHSLGSDHEEDDNHPGATSTKTEATATKGSHRNLPTGVQLDIALCPGPDPKNSAASQSGNNSLSVEIEDLQSIVHGGHHAHHHPHVQQHQPIQHQGPAIHGGGIHWTPSGTPTGTPTPEMQEQHQQHQPQQQHSHPPQHQPQEGQPAQVSTEVVAPQPQVPTYTINYGYPSPEVNLRPARPPCSRVIWTQETCLDCGRVQERCWLCSKHCPGCGSNRSPPHVRHQRYLNIQMLRRDMMRKHVDLQREHAKMKREGKSAATESKPGSSNNSSNSNNNSSSSRTHIQGPLPALVYPRLVHPATTASTGSTSRPTFNNQGPPTATLDPQLSLPEFALFD
ncbi:hypothetical protein DFQ27_000126 [Actinomortierella ambigua]|uniref:F-box domain-containing protein n=1 Tax=Actinomortierella ambigua TaxID=1343610 RepID=A0A9P6QI88_9FUNG|nr:hypothetical protein DFQ27_000126 [Actinomortierella ambigua]